jgi:hypothetical protein
LSSGLIPDDIRGINILVNDVVGVDFSQTVGNVYGKREKIFKRNFI